jgi:hypothetical protein|tara:strand:+ start:110 stop:316 length:207 start_codon:yes stop_codon:yes gene_type:complete
MKETTNQVPMTKEEQEKIITELLFVARCSLADLEGIMPEYEPNGDRSHSGWKTIEELKVAINLAESRR